jgi:hypothetical protein
MGRQHTSILHAILRRFATRPDMRIWPAQTGLARYGRRTVRHGISGQADLTGILAGGRRLEIEVKTPGDSQSPEQKAYQAIIENFGGLYVLARSPEDVDAALSEYVGEKPCQQ